MFDRNRGGTWGRRGTPLHEDGRPSRRENRPRVETLEGRALMAASLAPIGTISVPALQGFQVPLDGGSGPQQTYSVTSSNPDIKASVAQGKFMTLNVTHTAASASDVSFSGSLTFQLFDDLTPLTTSRIEELVNRGFYNGKNFHRIAPGFPGPTDYIAQGGSVNGDGTGDVGLPGFPFQDEFVQQLAFTGQGQLAMANAGSDTNSSQFFVTTGSPQFLSYHHAIFAQLVSGQDILNQMTKVQTGGANGTTPVNPITITTASLSDTSPDGVIHIDTTQAQQGESASITVTASQPSTGTTAQQTFQVNVGPQPTTTWAFLGPIGDQTVGENQISTFQLTSTDVNAGAVPVYTVQGGVSNGAFVPVQNATATVDANGLVTVVPDPNFTGTINLLVGVRDQVNHTGSTSLDVPGNFDTQAITLTVTPTDNPPQIGNTNSVRTVGNVLVVTPPPQAGNTHKQSNTISIDQVGGVLQVEVNGVIDQQYPVVSALDRLVVFGTRASDTITISPNVTLPATLDGGHGGINVIQAGGGPTREHGWFGHNTLTGGPQNDALIGRVTRARFRPSGGTDLLFLGTPHHPASQHGQAIPPGGTFVHLGKNRSWPLVTPKPRHQRYTDQSAPVLQSEGPTTTSTTSTGLNTNGLGGLGGLTA